MYFCDCKNLAAGFCVMARTSSKLKSFECNSFQFSLEWDMKWTLQSSEFPKFRL